MGSSAGGDGWNSAGPSTERYVFGYQTWIFNLFPLSPPPNPWFKLKKPKTKKTFMDKLTILFYTLKSKLCWTWLFSWFSMYHCCSKQVLWTFFFIYVKLYEPIIGRGFNGKYLWMDRQVWMFCWNAFNLVWGFSFISSQRTSCLLLFSCSVFFYFFIFILLKK